MPAIYTYKELQDQVLATLDEAGDTSTTLTLVKNYLNQAQQARLASANWPFLRWEEGELVTIVSGQRFYALHPEFWRPIYFFNTGTKAFCRLIPERMTSQSQNRWLTDTGRAQDFRWAGFSPVSAQPTAASTVTILSTSDTDSGATYGVTVTGVVGGIVRSEVINPFGQTPGSGTLLFTKILRVTLTTPWNGTLTMGASAQTLLVLGPGEYGRAFPRIEFLAIPDTADTIEYKFYRQPLKMVADNDIPEIPPPHSQILVWDTLMLFGGYNTDIRAQSVELWKEMRDKMDVAMREDYLEGQEIDAMPRLIRDLEDQWDGGYWGAGGAAAASGGGGFPGR